MSMLINAKGLKNRKRINHQRANILNQGVWQLPPGGPLMELINK
jgi:hypothetical protein